MILCVEDEKNEYGQFLKFEFLTKAPIDLEALDIRFMDDADIERLNTYHKDVYETISPYMNDEEKEWLKHATREISRKYDVTVQPCTGLNEYGNKKMSWLNCNNIIPPV